MKKFLFILFIFISGTSFSKGFELEFKAKYQGKTISGTDASSSTGKLVTKSSLDPALLFSYRFAKAWTLLLNYENQTNVFKNEKGFISGETSFLAASQAVGLRWIFLNSVAFRLMYTIEDQYGFEVNGSNLAEVFKESISYASFFYDQILYTGSGYFLGFNLGVDISANGSTFLNRSGSRMGGFLKMGAFGISGEIKNCTFESDAWKYETQDRSIELTYALSF